MEERQEGLPPPLAFLSPGGGQRRAAMERPVVIATVGGEGTRLFPLTLRQPKALINLCGRAVVDRIFETLATQGCREFIIASKGARNTNRLKEYFKDGKGFSGRLRLRPEAAFRYQPNYEDRGNADAVRFCMEYYDVDRDVLVVSGDNVIDITLRDLMEYHRKKESILTVGIKELAMDEDVSGYGVVGLEGESRIKRFVEKPKPEEAPSRFINTSIYVFSPRIREVFREMGDEVRDIGQDVIPYLTDRGYPVYGYEVEGYWADVGVPEIFLKTSQDILHGRLSRIKFDAQTTLLQLHGASTLKTEKSRWVHPSTMERLDQSVGIGAYANIGADCRIGRNAYIESSFIGDGCVIGEGVRIKGSVVMDFVNVERNVYLNGCIVARYATIGENAVIDADIPVDYTNKDSTPVIGEGVKILRNSVIGPGKKVAPVYESHRILATGRYTELGYDKYNIYFTEG